MEYHLAPSLVKLRDQVNARWPERDKGSDGWIGDPSHQARPSDHNPDYADGGIVRALDIDKDGINVDELLAAAIGEPRVAYVIWNRRIWTHAAGWQPYTGTNAHTAHIHVSIRHTSVAAAGGAWALGGTVKPAGTIKPKPPTSKPAGKSVATMAAEVIAGRHGTGHDARRRSLGVSAAVYEKVRAEVNRRAGAKTPAAGKSISQMATEVIQGKHGNGHPARQKSLGVSNATYAHVRAEVNKRA
ncbi:hypothetical protein ACFY5D_03750 [Paeniglutamicibacter sp. NPDC012692]|uniref:hypothetical protein n=1 Tax=Paeniglutamicibacter sp. NPDC012692 TaxID=3364388 RepID=UPI0036CC400B